PDEPERGGRLVFRQHTQTIGQEKRLIGPVAAPFLPDFESFGDAVLQRQCRFLQRLVRSAEETATVAEILGTRANRELRRELVTPVERAARGMHWWGGAEKTLDHIIALDHELKFGSRLPTSVCIDDVQAAVRSRPDRPKRHPLYGRQAGIGHDGKGHKLEV